LILFLSNKNISFVRLAHRAKFRKSKQALNQDGSHINEIFGIKINHNDDDDDDVEQSSSIINLESRSYIDKVKFREKKDSNIIGIQTTVNQMNTQEYFANKLKFMNISGIASSGLVKKGSSHDDDHIEEANDHDSERSSKSSIVINHKKRKADRNFSNSNSNEISNNDSQFDSLKSKTRKKEKRKRDKDILIKKKKSSKKEK
jgi:hypothetical protein